MNLNLNTDIDMIGMNIFQSLLWEPSNVPAPKNNYYYLKALASKILGFPEIPDEELIHSYMIMKMNEKWGSN